MASFTKTNKKQSSTNPKRNEKDFEDDSDSNEDDLDSGDDGVDNEDNLDGDDGDDDDDNDQGDDVKELKIDFELVDPKEDHYHSIRQFLKDFLDGKEFYGGDLADKIIAQSHVGSVIQVDGSEDAFGFITLVNLAATKSLPSLQKLRSYLLEKAKGGEQRTRMESLLNNERVGLILNERLINVPPELSPHLHERLHQEIEWAIEDDEAEGKPTPSEFAVSKFVIVITIFSEPVKKAKGRGGRGGSSSSNSDITGDISYKNPEEEYYHQHAEFSYAFKVTKNDMKWRWTLGGNVSETKVVCVVDKSRIPTILKQMKAALGGSSPPSPSSSSSTTIGGKGKRKGIDEAETTSDEPPTLQLSKKKKTKSDKE